MQRVIRLVLSLALLICGRNVLIAQESPRWFQEVGASYGAVLKPKVTPSPSLRYAIGKAKSLVSFEISRDKFSNYAVGVGNFFCPFCSGGPMYQEPISDSTTVDLRLNYERDVVTVHRVALLATAGWGHATSKTTVTNVCDLLCDLIPPYGQIKLVPQTERTSAMELGLGVGVRVPLTHGFGIRTEAKLWRRAGGITEDGYYPFYGSNVVRASIGFYYRNP